MSTSTVRATLPGIVYIPVYGGHIRPTNFSIMELLGPAVVVIFCGRIEFT